MKNDTLSILSIVIPTYNRAEILKENLDNILEDLIKYDIPIFVSDDSTNDDTKIVINDLKKKHNKIYYFKNTPSLGHDKNCIASLKLSSSNYIWYLGDSMMIKKGSILKILSIIESEDPDFISFKDENRNIHINTVIINKSKIIFNDFSWHLTMSGATIYKRSNLKLNDFSSEKFKNFPQLGLIFCNFKDNITKFYWLNEDLIVANNKKISYWKNDVFQVFFRDLEQSLLHFPQKFSTSEVEKVINKHSVYSEIFGVNNLIKLRISGIFNFYSFRNYYRYFYRNTSCNVLFLFILSVYPKILLRTIYNAIKNIK